ncbi:uncharacterized protein LOC102801703 [Saccoglossus kowalevskii]|uniref:Fibropellin-1-like n=1 Tax=Saccoglossus kowalevskii TaxID=10224 RepID=A0ABM0N041_SACKO|nr:PREDICTED: fibropellin-1-like [Saccoglossus kowalevskii]
MPDLCSSEPCQNGGACVQSGDMIVCTCEEGYGGMLCELYETRCEDQPCLNGATCYQDPNTPQFVCTCTVGFIGVNCEIDIDNSCASDPCVYGSCSNAHTGYLCDCMQGWTGKNCHQEINLSGNGFLISTTEQDGDSLPRLPKDDEGLDAAVVTAIALSMVIGIVIGIVVTVFIYCVRKRRIRRDAYLRSGEKMNNRHETTDQEATVDNDMVLRSYESMTSIDELPDPTPAVILTRETYYELGDDQLRNNEHVSQGREPISANEDALPDRIHNNLAPSLNDSEEDNELAITVDSVAH